MVKNLVISGGNATSILAEQMDAEMKHVKPAISRNDHASNAVWVGGSVLGNMAEFRDNWLTRDEFDELGVKALYAKCQVAKI
jgi:actin-related protein